MRGEDTVFVRADDENDAAQMWQSYLTDQGATDIEIHKVAEMEMDTDIEQMELFATSNTIN
jgi:hypothetical protein